MKIFNLLFDMETADEVNDDADVVEVDLDKESEKLET